MAKVIGTLLFGVAIFFVLAQFIDGRLAFLLGLAFVVVARAVQSGRAARKKYLDGLGLSDEESRLLQEDIRKGERDAAVQRIAAAQERQRAKLQETTGIDFRDTPPMIGSDISWADIVNHAFRVLEFDRAGTVVGEDNQVQAESPTAPYGYLLVESPILNQKVLLPITHAFDFLLATTVYDDPELTDGLVAQQIELLVTYSPKKLKAGGVSGSPHHVLHYALATRGALDSYYSADEDAHMANPEPHALFGPFVYEGPTLVRVSPELRAYVLGQNCDDVSPDNAQSDNSGTTYNRGLELAGAGKYREAIQCYDEALRELHSDANVWYSKGASLFYLGEYDAAITCFSQAIRLNPDDPDPYYGMGASADRIGRADTAKRGYHQFLGRATDASDKSDIASAHRRLRALEGGREPPPTSDSGV